MNGDIIKMVKAREILDSRGNPTVEVDVILNDGSFGRASVPSGASTGKREALELRDGDSRFLGKGVLKAVGNVNNIIGPALIGMSVFDQELIDQRMIELDGTFNKSNLGANAILAVSMAVFKASCRNGKFYERAGDGRRLPVCMMNILNGGVHADNGLDFQEFMIVVNADSVKERIRIGSEVFHHLKLVLLNDGFNTNVGDEGGFAPDFKSNILALDAIVKAIENAGYLPSVDVSIALDVAASEFYSDGFYHLKGEGRRLTSSELIDYYEYLISKYPIISIEDPVDQDDWDGFVKITDRLGDRVLLVGDDLFVTNKKYLSKGISLNAGNAILIKVNQIGTISETLETIKLAKDNNYVTIISHRSGETEDTLIADLAVGLDLGWIKTGSLSRTDRVCKYNRLIRIEEGIGYENE